MGDYTVMLFENTDKKCPSCKGKVMGVRLDNKMKYVCDECGTTIYIPINEDAKDEHILLKG